jgi:RNA polymerase sigma-70 factor (ECF subfamily)
VSILDARAISDAANAARLRQAALDATFSGFFTANHLAVERFLHRLEPDRGMVEDVSQEAFMAVRAKWADVQAYENPQAWVMVVARNILRDHQRQRGRVRAIFFDDVRMPEIPAPATPIEADDRLAGWIQLLPPRMGEVISLSLEGLPDRAIGLALGIAHNTVRDCKVQARRKLKQLAEADGFSTPAGRRRK